MPEMLHKIYSVILMHFKKVILTVSFIAAMVLIIQVIDTQLVCGNSQFMVIINSRPFMVIVVFMIEEIYH